MYDANGIQPQGRLFEIGEKTSSESGQCRKGAKRKEKDDGQKQRDRDRHKELRRLRREGLAKPAVITKEPFWLECSKCLAKIGLGSKMAGKIIGVHSVSVSTWWKRKGIISEIPKEGSWFNVVKSKNAEGNDKERERIRKEKQAKRKAENRQIKAWMVGKNEWAGMIYREKVRVSSLKRYHSMTPEQKRKYNSKWKLRCPIKRREYSNKWKGERRKADPIYKVIESFRCRLSAIARTRSDHTMDLIGCSPNQLRKHLQTQFKRDMTWDNYGTHWHVDHILPVSSFDHTNQNQLRQCWHWTNLQPLEAKKNLLKSNRIVEPQMKLLLCATH